MAAMGLAAAGLARAGTATIALTDQALPEGNGLFSFLGNPVLNGAGQVAFNAFLKNTSGGATDDTGLYLHNGSALLNLARENDAAPEGNGLFSGLNFFVNPALNGAGQVAFNATLKNTSGGAFDDSGIYLHDGTVLLNRARENNAVPEGNGLFNSFGTSPVLNGAGQVAFNATLKNTSGGGTDDSGIYLSDGVEQLKVVREGDTLAGETVSSLGGNPPSLNDYGQVAYRANCSDGGTSSHRCGCSWLRAAIGRRPASSTADIVEGCASEAGY